MLSRRARPLTGLVEVGPAGVVLVVLVLVVVETALGGFAGAVVRMGGGYREDGVPPALRREMEDETEVICRGCRVDRADVWLKGFGMVFAEV